MKGLLYLSIFVILVNVTIASPIETAVADIDDSNSIVTECQGVLINCIARPGPFEEKLHCFVEVATCVGKKAAVCASSCVLPFAVCQMAVGVTWPAFKKCGKKFLSCSVDTCMKNEESLALEADFRHYEALVADLAESNNIVSECKEVLSVCLDKSITMKEKAHCFVDLGECVAEKAVVCVKPCLMPYAMCQLAAGVTWPALMKCGEEFLTCSMAACMKDEAPNNIVALQLGVEMSPYEFAIQAVDDNSVSFNNCKNKFNTCVQTEKDTSEKFECFMKFGKCIGGELIGCSAHCLPQFALCRYEAEGSWLKNAYCAVQFLSCARQGCTEDD